MALAFVSLFFLLFVPNILRHLSYWSVYKKTGKLDHIVSYETRLIYKNGKIPLKGVFEEVGIGLVYTFLWFQFPVTRFLAYGWLTDALLDVFYAAYFLFKGKTPIMYLTENLHKRFAVREIIIPYLVVGTILAYFAVNITVFALIVLGLNILNQAAILMKK